MRYPAFLEENGRIGFIAPAYGVGGPAYYRVRFEEAEKNFRKLGYQCIEGPNCYENKGIGKSNTPEKCGEEINDFFLNDRSDVILSCGGGETMCEDLPYVRFDEIAKAKPKWYCGYSDNTNLTFLLTTLCDTASIYGPNATAFGMRPWHPSLLDCMRILTGKTDKPSAAAATGAPAFTIHNYQAWEREDSTDKSADEEEADFLAPYEESEPFKLSVFAAGSRRSTNTKVEMEGRLLGGCLDVLCDLCGTRYDRVKEFNEKYRQDGILWFLESCDLSVVSIRRALFHLREAGWFDTARGFLIGRAYRYDDEFEDMNRLSAVTGALSELKVPIMIDADLGHLPPAMPIITGAYGKVTAENNRLELVQMLR